MARVQLDVCFLLTESLSQLVAEQLDLSQPCRACRTRVQGFLLESAVSRLNTRERAALQRKLWQ